MPTIIVSAETFKRLQSHAVPFVHKEPEDVIIEILDKVEANATHQTKESYNGSEGRPLASHVGTVPHGSSLRARYKGKEYRAEVVDGEVHWNGNRYSSLSSAAVAVIQSTGSKRGTENGWRFWEAKTPDSDRWVPGTELQD